MDQTTNHVSSTQWEPCPKPLSIELRSQLCPFSEKPPKLKLKPLPEHLKYANLGANETFPIIIAVNLTKSQEEALLSILRENREAIKWTMIDIKEISLTIIQYRFHLIEEAKPSRDPQHRLSPVMKEAFRKDILKCFDNWIIFLIALGLAHSKSCLRSPESP